MEMGYWESSLILESKIDLPVASQTNAARNKNNTSCCNIKEHYHGVIGVQYFYYPLVLLIGKNIDDVFWKCFQILNLFWIVEWGINGNFLDYYNENLNLMSHS